MDIAIPAVVAAAHLAPVQAALYALKPGLRGTPAADGGDSGLAPQQACEQLLQTMVEICLSAAASLPAEHVEHGISVQQHLPLAVLGDLATAPVAAAVLQAGVQAGAYAGEACLAHSPGALSPLLSAVLTLTPAQSWPHFPC